VAKTVKQPKGNRSSRGTWKVFNAGTTLMGGILARQVASTTWRVTTGRKPPTETQHPDLRAVEALTWAAITGASVELTKVFINRKAVSYWMRSTGNLPPGLKPIDRVEGAAKM